MLESGYATQRRPAGDGVLVLVLNGVPYPLKQIDQAGMNAMLKGNEEYRELVGYPVFWCERGLSWIQVFPRPPHRDDMAIMFATNQT